MTTRMLRLDSSLFGAGGASTQLNDHLIEELQRRHGDIRVIQRDLARDPPPYVTAEFLRALSKKPEERTGDETRQVAQSDQLIQELRQADVLVVGAPMYNFSVPSPLKTWMDHVARAGETFRYTSTGPEGLVGSKKVYIVTSRGGLHKGQPSDGVVPLLKAFFGLLSLTDIEVIYAEGLNMGDGNRDKGLARARQTISQVAA